MLHNSALQCSSVNCIALHCSAMQFIGFKKKKSLKIKCNVYQPPKQKYLEEHWFKQLCINIHCNTLPYTASHFTCTALALHLHCTCTALHYIYFFFTVKKIKCNVYPPLQQHNESQILNANIHANAQQFRALHELD